MEIKKTVSEDRRITMGDDRFYQAELDMLAKRYGTFNGKSTIPNFNREQRREYIKNHKHDRNASICPHCKQKTIKITDDNSKEFCELCGLLTVYEKVHVFCDELVGGINNDC